MTHITFAEIAQFRSQLTEYPATLQALDLIEDCEGDVEDAAIVLALQAGLEPDRTDQLLEGLAKRYRGLICQENAIAQLSTGSIAALVEQLLEEDALPAELAAPVAIYAVKIGTTHFCQSPVEN